MREILHRRPGSWRLLAAVLLCLGGPLGLWPAAGVMRDGGIDPANLGKGDWIYFMSATTNRLGGNVPSVTNEHSLMQFYKSQGIRYVIVKAATSDYLFNGSYPFPQFTSNLVNIAHEHGLLIFGYNRSYGSNIVGEIAISDYVFQQGADGFVWDAEAEWESHQPWIGNNGPALAWQLCSAVRSNWPNKFLAHAPFPVISYHASFPYKEFGYWCDAVMPQIYPSGWTGVKSRPSGGINWTDVNWRNWQNSLWGQSSVINGQTIYWTNSIKPLAPVNHVYVDSIPDEFVMEFVDYLNADPHSPSVGGYQGANFWRADLHGAAQWANIRASTIGSFPGIVNNIVMDDPSATANGGWTAVRTFYNGGFYGNGTGMDTNSFGTNYLTCEQGTGSGFVEFRPHVIVPGEYDVYEWHPFVANASLTVPFAITHAGRTLLGYANQQTNPGTWSWLGRFPFDAGTNGRVRFTDGFPEADAVALADGIKLVFVAATEPPVAPSELTASAASGSQIDLAWTNYATNAVHVIVARATAEGGPYADVVVLPLTSTTFNDTGLMGETTYHYVVRAINAAGESPHSAPAGATTFPSPPLITAQPQSQDRTPGQTATLEVTAIGSAPLSYQWLKNGVSLSDGGNVSGAATSRLTLSHLLGNDSGEYAVVITNPRGTVTSMIATLLVLDPYVASQPVSQIRQPGQSATFGVTALGTPPLGYQWFKDGTPLSDGGNVSGAATPQLTLNPVFGNDSGNYRVVVSSPHSSATSQVATLTVLDPFITSQPASQNREPDQSVTFSVIAVGSPPLSYQWRKDGGALTGATEDSLTLTDLQASDAGDYTVVVSNPYGSVTSVVASLDVRNWVTHFADDFESDTSGRWKLNASSEDTRVTFHYDYSADGIPPAPNSAGGSTRGVKMEANLTQGRTAAVSLSPLGLALPGDYQLRFDLWMNAYGPFPAGGVGTTEHFTAGVGTTGNQVQWLGAGSSADGVWFAGTGEGGTSDTTTASVPDFAAACGTSLQSAASGVYAAGNESNARGNGHPYYAVAFPGGQTPPAWQRDTYPQQSGGLNPGTLGFVWRQVVITKIGDTVEWSIDGLRIATVMGATLAGSNVFVGYYDAFSSLSENPALSFGVVDNVEATAIPPRIVLQPQDQIVPWLSNATFRVTAAGTEPLSYQWLRDGLALADGGNTSGATNPALTLSNVVWSGRGAYSVVIANAQGSVTSQVATLTVLDPFITSQPAFQNGQPGDSVSFSVTAVGTPPFGFQWLKDGYPLADATLSTLTLHNLQDGDAGGYRVVVSNAYGSITSSVALLSVGWGRVDSGFNPNANGIVRCLAVQPDGRILVAGEFTVLNGLARSRLARLNPDGTLDSSFSASAGIGSGYGAYSLAVQTDGKILVGGQFGTLCGVNRQHIGRLNPDGTLDAAFNPAVVGNLVESLAVQPDGKIVLVGHITQVRGVTRNNIARLNPNGTLDTGFNPRPSGLIFSVALQPDGKILIGGGFYLFSSNGQSHRYLARLNPDGSLDVSFNPNPGGTVNCIAVQPDGKILVGGRFDSLGGQSRNRIARLHPDGTVDLSFNPGAAATINYIWSFALQTDGRIMVAGYFSRMAGQTRNNIARLNPDGTLDSAFNPGASGAGHLYTLSSLAIQPDGKILAGGIFTTFGGQPRNGIARLNNTAPAVQNLTYDGSTVWWYRGSCSPEVWRTTLEVLSGGTNWLAEGAGLQIPGGWRWPNVFLPTNSVIRARGFVEGGYDNGSGSFVETTLVTTARPPQPESAITIVWDTWADGLRTNVPITASNTLWYASTAASLIARTNSLLGLLPATGGRLWVGCFTDEASGPVNLDVGQTIRATLVFTPTNVATWPGEDTQRGLRFGLFDYADGTSRLTGDTFSTGGGNGWNVRGYLLNQNFFTTFVLDEPMQILVRTNLASTSLMGSTANDYISLATGPTGWLNAPGFRSGMEYTLRFSVTRIASDVMEITTRISGDQLNFAFTTKDTSPYAVHRFDTFGIRPASAETSAEAFTFSEFKVEVGERPSILMQPQNATVVAGASAVLFVSAEGSLPFSYQWSFNGTPIPGATASVLALTNVQDANEGLYSVVVGNAVGEVTSSDAMLEVLTTAQMVELLMTAASADVARAQPLLASLSAALASIDRSNPVSAINQLLAFQNQVRAQVGPLDAALAASFIQQAQELIDALSGGNTNPGGRPHGRFTAVERQPNGQVTLQFIGERGGIYIVAASTDLVDWELIGVATDRGEGAFTFDDPHAARFAERYYRLVQP